MLSLADPFRSSVLLRQRESLQAKAIPLQSDAIPLPTPAVPLHRSATPSNSVVFQFAALP
jgi:hypothetical protein